METWFTAVEHHVSFAAILTLTGIVLREYKVYGRIKERLNELWFDYCGEKQKLYSPLENGMTPVVPPRPNIDRA